MNFPEKIIEGQQGKNIGLSTGLPKFDRAIDNIQKKAIYCIAAAPKVGKTTFVDFAFVLEPFLYYLQFLQLNPQTLMKVKWIYFSFEIDRVKKEIKYASYFMMKDFGVYMFMHKGVLIPISPRYLEGKLKDQDDEMIKLLPEHLEMLKTIYINRIIPMFGEYNKVGKKIKDGFIDFIEDRDNPTGLRNYIFQYAKVNGEFIFEPYKTRDETGKEVIKQRLSGYRENNPELTTIIITDHVRKLKKERNFSMKENIDKWIEYQVELRNWCKFTFVDVVHLNRSISDPQRIRQFGEVLYPTGDDVKDTGNISEEADYVITIFNPQDEKYNVKKHFGLDLCDENGNSAYPYYRSVHLVESRDTECPMHLKTNMFGNNNNFQEL